MSLGKDNRFRLRCGRLCRKISRPILLHNGLIAKLHPQRKQADGEREAQLAIGYTWCDERARESSGDASDDKASQESCVEVTAREVQAAAGKSDA